MQKEENREKLADVLRKAEIPDKKREIILKNAGDKLEKEKTMSLSIREGAAASVMSGFGDAYITPYALTLNANNAQIGFLSSFAGLVSPLSQLFGSKLMEKYPRKRIIMTFVTFHAIMWIPILLLSLFFWKNIFLSYLPIFLIIFYSVYAIFGAVAGPAWFSLLGDIVPDKIRGRYFSKRNKITGTIALVSTVIAAFILDFFKTKGYILIGFSILFVIAGIFRLVSASMFRKHYEPSFKLEKGYYFSIWQFIKKAPSNNFGKFVIFITLMNFTTSIAGPFFAVYMLKDLQFSYITFILVNISSSISSLLFMPIWGKFSDKYGNREMLKIGAIVVPFFPMLWIFSSSPLYLALVPQLVGGIGWAAFNLAASNFVYDSVSVQRRGLCVAYYNIIVGIGVFFGAALGGILAHYLTITFMNKLLFIFLISGLARLAVTIIFMPSIKEVRKVEKPKINPLFYFKEIKPMKGIVYEMAGDIRGIGGFFRDKVKSRVKKSK
ncbi:MAG: MFS transporter [Nanoarchaeota archaeon]